MPIVFPVIIWFGHAHEKLKMQLIYSIASIVGLHFRSTIFEVDFFQDKNRAKSDTLLGKARTACIPPSALFQSKKEKS